MAEAELDVPKLEITPFRSPEPFMDEPAKFNTAMTELVRPVLSSGASSAG